MKLDEEKKLVADWMGWKYYSSTSRTCIYEKKSGYKFDLRKWEPYNEDVCKYKWWYDIWNNMDKEMKSAYYGKLYQCQEMKHGKPMLWFRLHTAKPEICWKALIITLKGIV